MGRWGCCCVFPRNPAASLFQLKHLGKSSSDTVYEFFLPQIQRNFWYAKCLAQNHEASDLQLLLVCFGLSFTLAKPTLQTTSSFGSLFKCQLDLICVTLESVRYCFALLLNSYKTRNHFWLLVRPLHANQLCKSRCTCSWLKMAMELFSLSRRWESQLLQPRLQCCSHEKRQLSSVAGKQCWVVLSQPLRFQPKAELKRTALWSTM